MVVDLPEPLGPMSPYTSPGMMRSETPSTARSGLRRKDVLKSFTRLRISTAGAVSAIGGAMMDRLRRRRNGQFHPPPGSREDEIHAGSCDGLATRGGGGDRGRRAGKTAPASMKGFSEVVPVLQISIGPVILISGVGLLLLSLTNRYGRVIDRSRFLGDGLRKSGDSTGHVARTDPDSPAARQAAPHLDRLWRRLRALRGGAGDRNLRRFAASPCLGGLRGGDVFQLHALADRVAGLFSSGREPVARRAGSGHGGCGETRASPLAGSRRPARAGHFQACLRVWPAP